MTQGIKALATEPDNLNLTPKIHMMEIEDQLLKLSSDFYLCAIEQMNPFQNKLQTIKSKKEVREMAYCVEICCTSMRSKASIQNQYKAGNSVSVSNPRTPTMRCEVDTGESLEEHESASLVLKEGEDEHLYPRLSSSFHIYCGMHMPSLIDIYAHTVCKNIHIPYTNIHISYTSTFMPHTHTHMHTPQKSTHKISKK